MMWFNSRFLVTAVSWYSGNAGVLPGAGGGPRPQSGPGPTQGPAQFAGQRVQRSAEDCTGPRTFQQWLDTTLGNGSYSTQTRPGVARAELDPTQFADMAPPETVHMRLDIQQINSVDDVSQIIKIYVLQTMSWVDWRLRQPTIAQGGCLGKPFGEVRLAYIKGKMWMPDVFVVNAADSETFKGKCLFAQPGDVFCTSLHEYEISCAMDFSRMPFDVQHCHMEMGTFVDSAADVELRPMEDPINFEGTGLGTVEWNVTDASVKTGVWKAKGLPYRRSQIFFNFTLARKSGYYVKMVITPTICVILICWLSFFVDKGAVPARCAVTVIAFLTLTNQITGITSKLPRLTNNVWLLVLLEGSRWFAFSTIMEYGVVNTLVRYEAALTQAKVAAEKKSEHDEELEKPTAAELDLDTSHGVRQVPRESSRNMPLNLRHYPMNLDSGRDHKVGPVIAETNSQVGGNTSKFDIGQEQQQQHQQTQQQHQQRQQQKQQQRQSLVAQSCYGACVTWLLVTKTGNMRIRGIDLDVFSRWAYPLAYLVFCLIMLAEL